MDFLGPCGLRGLDQAYAAGSGPGPALATDMDSHARAAAQRLRAVSGHGNTR